MFESLLSRLNILKKSDKRLYNAFVNNTYDLCLLSKNKHEDKDYQDDYNKLKKLDKRYSYPNNLFYGNPPEMILVDLSVLKDKDVRSSLYNHYKDKILYFLLI